MGRRARQHRVREPHRWGTPPWQVRFHPSTRPLPTAVDVAVIGGGFTGLALACWLRRLAPTKSVAVLEAAPALGAGASGRTGGIVLNESAVGPLPDLGNVLRGFRRALRTLKIDCGLQTGGAWEIARSDAPRSLIHWNDSGSLRVTGRVPGGMLDPGRLLSGLARAAQSAGASIHLNTPVLDLHPGRPLQLALRRGTLKAEHVIVGVNGYPLGVQPWKLGGRTKLTMALATEPLSRKQLRALSSAPLKPFYTVDLPYLWGRPLPGNRLIFGGGLVHLDRAEELEEIDVRRGEAARLLDSLEERVRGLVPALATVRFSHRWGGPILFAPAGQPILCRHPDSDRVIVLGGYTGQGVALSVYLARWAAEALLGRRALPPWERPQL